MDKRDENDKTSSKNPDETNEETTLSDVNGTITTNCDTCDVAESADHDEVDKAQEGHRIETDSRKRSISPSDNVHNDTTGPSISKIIRSGQVANADVNDQETETTAATQTAAVSDDKPQAIVDEICMENTNQATALPNAIENEPRLEIPIISIVLHAEAAQPEQNMSVAELVANVREYSSAATIQRLRREAMDMRTDPPPGCSAGPIDDNLQVWTATIIGPTDTVYDGGVFHLQVQFPPNYPVRPMYIRFITPIYHCNVDEAGNICLDVLREKWSPALTVSKVLLSILCLLQECNADDPLRSSIARQFLTKRADFNKTARQWTRKYAQNE